jgi:hypothetical protein
MSQFYWIFVNKNYLMLTIVLAALIVPIGYVTADVYFGPESIDTESDGENSFTGLDGASGVATMYNGTDPQALVISFMDRAVTMVDLANPQNTMVIDTLHSGVTMEGRLNLNGSSSITTWTNSTTNYDGTHALITSFLGDGVQLIHAPGVSTTHAMYATHNMTGSTSSGGSPDGKNSNCLGSAKGPVLSGLNGAMDSAVFHNHTVGFDKKYAIVTGHQGDAIQLLDISDTGDIEGKIYCAGWGGNHATSNATATGGSAYASVGNYGGKIPIDGAYGVDIIYDTDQGNMPYAIVTGQVSDGFQIFSLNDTEKGLVPFANRTSAVSGFELLDSPTAVAVWNTTNLDSNRYALIASNYTDSLTVVHLEDLGATTVLDTLSQTGSMALDGPVDIAITKIEDRHYAFVAGNGTATYTTTGSSVNNILTGGIQVVDLYDPTDIKPVASVVDGQSNQDSLVVNKLDRAQGIATFKLDGYIYTASAAYDDDGLEIIKITSAKPSTGSGSICGVNTDCTAPSVSTNGGGVSINGGTLVTEDRFNDADLVEAKIGQMVTVKANIYDTFGLYKSNLYFDMQDAPEWSDADAGILYDMARDEITIFDTNDIFDADVSHTTSGDVTTVTFKIMFTGEMDSSHIAIQNIDDSRNYQLKYFRDAIEVTGTPTQTSLDDDSIAGEVTQTATASVPDWVKNTAGWWAEGAITEGEFVRGVEFLIKEQIIDTDAQTTSSEATGTSVPDWVKNTAGWWADGAITEGEFVNAIEHLVKTGTIIII